MRSQEARYVITNSFTVAVTKYKIPVTLGSMVIDCSELNKKEVVATLQAWADDLERRNQSATPDNRFMCNQLEPDVVRCALKEELSRLYGHGITLNYVLYKKSNGLLKMSDYNKDTNEARIQIVRKLASVIRRTPYQKVSSS